MPTVLFGKESYLMIYAYLQSLLPLGKVCFNRLPYGISTGSEKFQKCISYRLGGIEGAECQVLDVIVHGSDQAQHDERWYGALKTTSSDKCDIKSCEM